MAAVLIEGATRPGYDSIRHPISSLALGDQGWTQTAVFLITGTLSLLLAAGLARGPGRRPRWAAVLISLWAVGLLGTGVFVTDPVSGYPIGTPDIPPGTASGQLHNLFALLGALAFVVACVVLRNRGGRGWRIGSLLTGALFLVTLVLASAGFGQADGLVAIGGLLDRIAVTAAWAWISVLALRTVSEQNLLRSGQSAAGGAALTVV
ncbi:DUF998 domain-containing protein [Catellatospora sp. TT07R-123]|uniref:DUF998 domain-containing protein n=1 Tax=Catellatospora sp. TT07R-123 TaxID=2733863 RepID=UPI001BB37AD4